MANPYFLTWQEVRDQVLSFLPPSWRAGLTGKVTNRLIVAFALAVEALYALLARLLRLSIVITSEGEWLRALVRGWGMEAFGGTSATVSVRFERYGDLSEAVEIPITTKPVARFGQVFQVSLPAVIPSGQSFVDVPCTALEPGLSGRIGIDEIVGLQTPVPGVNRVYNPNPGQGGSDPESDIEIKGRVPAYLESRHRATIPATEYAIALDRVAFPEVRGFTTQRSYNAPGYFRAILAEQTGGDIYRAQGWVLAGNGVWYVRTALTEINGLVSAGFPCRRFGVVTRAADGEETWNASAFVRDVEQGNWRWCHDRNLGRLYARADGRDLNTLACTIVAGVVWRALRTLERQWAANGVFLDVLVPFTVLGTITITYALEPGYTQTDVESALRIGISDYVASLGLGQGFELEGLYARLATVPGAAGVLVTTPATNVAVGADSVFRLSALPTISRRAI